MRFFSEGSKGTHYHLMQLGELGERPPAWSKGQVPVESLGTPEAEVTNIKTQP